MAVAELNLPTGQHGTPDDIATLYAWANMRGAKYRDFSASRSEARVAAKRRVEEAEEVARLKALEEEERAAQEAAQRAAREAAEQAEQLRRAEAERLAEIARQGEAERQAVLAAQEAQRKSLMHRLSHLGQRAEQRTEQQAGQPAEMRAEQQQAEQQPAEQQQAAQRADKGPGLQRGPERRGAIPPVPVSYPDDPWGREDVDNGGAGKSEDHGIPTPGIGQPFSMEEKSYGGHIGNDPAARERADRQADRQFDARPSPPQSHHERQPDRSVGRERPASSAENYGERSFSGQYPSQPALDEMSMPGLDAPILPSWLAELPMGGGVAQTPAHAHHPRPPQPPQRPVMVRRVEATAEIPQQHHFERSSPPVYSAEPAGQEWESSGYGSTAFPVHGDFRPQRLASQAPTSQAQSSVEDPLLASRERITRGWFALKSVFHPDQVSSEMQQPQAPGRTPVMALFSLAGGVGKTSLLASLGRALSARGERVLLVDLAAYGLLPFFFGARDQRPGQLRTFSPPGSTGDAPIQMITLDPETHKQETQKAEPTGGADGLIQEVMHHAHEASRILMDLPTASGATMRRVLRMNPTVLVPVVPDMNSVVSVGAIESFFQNQIASAHAQAQPVYILNQFDSSQQLHLDVREILREQIGNRLLPFALRRSPTVSEALAEGMTVMDYAPSSVIAEDYLNLANWVRSLSAPAAVAQRGVRWSER